MNPRKPPTLNAADARLIKNLLLDIERRLTAIERRLTRLEKKKETIKENHE